MKDSLDSSQLKKAVQVLETACRIRDRERLLREIPALLAGVRDSRYVRLRALDWYWRAGLHFEGVRTALADPAGGGPIASQQELLNLPEEQLLWASRFLISVGAWPFGRSLLPHLKPRSTRARILLAMDHLALGDYERVITLLEKVSAPSARETRWHILTTFARSYLELGDGARALKWADRGLEVVTTDPDRWVLECLRARALALRGELGQGLAEFEAAEKRFQDLARLAPHWYGYSRIWKGSLLAQDGKVAQARKVFEQGLRHYETGMQDLQQWRSLLVLDAMKSHGLLQGEELAAFERYPLKHPLCRSTADAEWNPARPETRFRLGADEWTDHDQLRLGIPLEWRLAAGLALAGDLGIHQNLLKCWLWPESLSHYFQLEGRLTQLVHRLRHEHGLEVLRERESFWLAPADRARIAVSHSTGEKPSFLIAKQGASFVASEIARHYALSPRMAQLIVSEWLEKGWILREGAGRATRYLPAGPVFPNAA